MADRLPASYGCEEEARIALLAAAAAPFGVRAQPAPRRRGASLSLRWRRSGADGFLLMPAALPGWLDSPDDILWMALDDERPPDIADRQRPPAEWPLHRHIHRQHREVGAIIRSRPVFCTTLACTAHVQQEGIPAFHPDVALAGGDSIRCAACGPDLPVASLAYAERVAAALEDRTACLLAARGLLATGPTLEAAAELSAEIETLAQIYWQVLQLDWRDA